MLIFTNVFIIPGIKTFHATGALLSNISTVSFKMEILVCVVLSGTSCKLYKLLHISLK